MKYVVEMWDEPDIGKPSWVPVSSEMCNPKRHCGCGNRKHGLANCSNNFWDTSDKKVAKDILENLQANHLKARIRTVANVQDDTKGDGKK